ncbi:hypothetical protein V6N13_081404 [Hibiscus sabdariffa]
MDDLVEMQATEPPSPQHTESPAEMLRDSSATMESFVFQGSGDKEMKSQSNHLVELTFIGLESWHISLLRILDMFVDFGVTHEPVFYADFESDHHWQQKKPHAVPSALRAKRPKPSHKTHGPTLSLERAGQNQDHIEPTW